MTKKESEESQTVTKIQLKDLILFFYSCKVMLTQKIKSLDHRKRRQFSNLAQENLLMKFLNEKRCFRYEKYVNQNCELLKIFHIRSQRRLCIQQKLVFGTANRMLAYHFFQIEEGNAIALNCEIYQIMIMNFLQPLKD